MGRAVPAAPDIPGGSGTSGGARPRRRSLPGQELLNGGQIPGARRLQQFLLLPHLTASGRRDDHTASRTHCTPLRLRNTHPRAARRALSPLRSARSTASGFFPLQAQLLRGNFLSQRRNKLPLARLDTSLPRRVRSSVTSHNHLITLMMVELHAFGGLIARPDILRSAQEQPGQFIRFLETSSSWGRVSYTAQIYLFFVIP